MPANYVLLQRIELNDSAASVTFSNIPQSGYTDLKIVWSLRQSTGPNNDIYISFNGSTSSFSSRSVEGAGAATNSGTVARYLGTVTNTTASTFASGEVYIPNYTSSNNKSFSSDNVGEANATQAYATLAAGLWSNTAAINSVTITPGAGNWVQYSTFSLYGLAAVGTTPVIAPKATGGNITSDGTYWIHTFNSTGTFTPLQGLTCDYLVVAGGGGGHYQTNSNGSGGGGGAGGLRSTVTATGGGGSLESPLSVSAQAYTITVGAGGVGTASPANGSNSVFSTITAIGGGKGGLFSSSGGSGGGAGGEYGGGGAGTANQGYNGGAGGVDGSNPGGGGAGGGAGANGAAGGASLGGAGGNGVAVSITGTSVTYAGGGGGQSKGSGTGGTGGTGGGGAGGNFSNTSGTAGTVNRGGGGGGAGYVSSGAGGSGIVIIRYPIA